ncbi:hypothetical protein ACJJTC_004440 [Scirpophaga incertulas]
MSQSVVVSALILFIASQANATLDAFFMEQADNINAFFKQKIGRVEKAVNQSYNDAVSTQHRVNNYIEEQKKKISEDVSNYIENVKETGREFVDQYTFVPTESEASRLDNPDLVLTVPSIIRRHGYDCETHTVLSEGFILNIHRIPRAKNGRGYNKNTVLLHHGLFASSADWILNGPDKSLAYVLADAGYDVWMANIRGNKYSKEHIRYKEKSKEYWNFSWHEVAVFDVPAVIDYIQVRPEYNNKLSVGIALAPEVFISNMESPLKSLAGITSNIAHTEIMYGSYEFVPKNSFFGQMHKMCEAQNMDSYESFNSLTSLRGHNRRVYGQATPPDYDLSRVTLNVTLFWAQNDLLSNEKDVRKLHEKLPTTTEMYLVPFNKFNHIDYLVAIDAPRLVNDKVLDVLQRSFVFERSPFYFDLRFG